MRIIPGSTIVCMEHGSEHCDIGGDELSSRQSRPPRGSCLGRSVVGALLAYFTCGSMFLYSGIIGHSHSPLVHPLAGHAGWILAGLSPLGAYLSFRLSGGRRRSIARMLLALTVAVFVFVGLQALGLGLLRHALPGEFGGHR